MEADFLHTITQKKTFYVFIPHNEIKHKKSCTRIRYTLPALTGVMVTMYQNYSLFVLHNKQDMIMIDSIEDEVKKCKRK